MSLPSSLRCRSTTLQVLVKVSLPKFLSRSWKGIGNGPRTKATENSFANSWHRLDPRKTKKLERDYRFEDGRTSESRARIGTFGPHCFRRAPAFARQNLTFGQRRF